MFGNVTALEGFLTGGGVCGGPRRAAAPRHRRAGEPPSQHPWRKAGQLNHLE